MPNTIIKSRAPFRISLAGGGTDVPPFCDLYGGAVLNIAISKYAYVALEKIEKGVKIQTLENIGGIYYKNKKDFLNNYQKDILSSVIKKYLPAEGGYKISFFLDGQPRSGIGSSAAAFVALIKALSYIKSLNLDRNLIAEEAWRLERYELKNVGGKQDQYASSYGGVNYLEFKENGKVEINPLRLDQKITLELESRILIFYYAPRTSSSGKIIEEQIKNIENKKKETIDALLRNKQIAQEIKRELLKNNIDEVGYLLDESWNQKKNYSSSISNSSLDKFYSNLKKIGVLGGKISGAGGGGYMFVLCNEKKTLDIYNYLKTAGFSPMFLKIDWEGAVQW
ncbi:MAG: hypothetical protein QXG16_03065 [Candidatus Anstonellaceae archaeon]